MATDPEDFDIDKPDDVLQAERNPDNAANEVAIAEKQRTKKAKENERIDALNTLLDTRAGREILAHYLFSVGGLNRTVQNAAFDTNSLHYREGMRDFAIIMQKDLLQANKKQYMVLLEEHLYNGM